MIVKSESNERRIVNFQRPFDFDFTPYKQFDFSEGVREYADTCPNSVTGLRICKVIVLGDIGVGKTCIIRRFCHETFENNYKATIGVDFEVERFEVLGTPFSLQIWDTAGQERFKSLATAYYRSTHIIIIVFDLSRIHTLQSCSQWLRDAIQQNQENPPHLFLVGNKLDVIGEKVYPSVEEMAVKVADRLGAEYWAVSSKEGTNITELFTRIVCLAFNASVVREMEANTNTLLIGEPTPESTQEFGLDPARKKIKKGCACTS